MTELEKKLHDVRKELNKAIEQLALEAIKDSTNYQSAIEKLNQFKWKLTGQASSIMIDLAIEFVKQRALESPIEKNC